MNTGQMLLTLFAVGLIGVTVLTVNQSFSQNGMILEQTEIGIYATSLAMSVIEEASGKGFDEETVDTVVSAVSAMTQCNCLGPESGESVATFDDFDDYNNHQRIIEVPGTDRFTIRSFVKYVKPDSPNDSTNVRTYHKKLTVFVSGPAMTDTVKVSYIFSYWNFR